MINGDKKYEVLFFPSSIRVNPLRNSKILLIILSLYILETGCKPPLAQPNAQVLPDRVDFNFHVRPILSDRCYACHGPDEKARKANLRLDIEAEAFAALDSAGAHFAIVRGDVDQSGLINRIYSEDPEEIMPPPESKLSLTDNEKEVLKKWIQQGAEWKEHWAFIPPSQAEIPEVDQKSWPQNPIDYFTLAKMEEAGMSPNLEASKEKLIRRLSFDLTGLAPTLEEIDAYLANEDPSAYEKLVDRLLASPRYGERMAMEWLDLARYADSHGYQDDLERSMWPWRDWVIEAFNKNMPYDQFVSWQLAGDLIPEATYEQKLATGFNRNHKITQEVGVVDEEYRVTYVLDRVNTFSTAFLGLTVECAQCHDHKYDPISQKEYYSLFSFFNQVPEKGRVDYGVEVAPPSIPLPEEKAKAVREYLLGLYDSQKSQQETYIQGKWKEKIRGENLAVRISSLSIPFDQNLKAWYPLDYSEDQLLLELSAGQHGENLNDLIPVPGQFSGGVECMGTNYGRLNAGADLDLNKGFSFSFWIKSLDGGIRGAVLAALSQKLNRKGLYVPNMLLEVTNDKTWHFYVQNHQNKTSLNIRSRHTLPENEWIHVVASYDGSKKVEGLRLFMNGERLEEPFEQENDLRGSIQPTRAMYLGSKNPWLDQQNKKKDQGAYFSGAAKGLQAGQLDELMVFDRALSDKEVAELYAFDPVKILEEKSSLSLEDRKRLFFQELFKEDDTFKTLSERLREFKIRKIRMRDIVLKPTMVMEDQKEYRPTYVLDRGQYDAPTVEVYAGTPQAVLAFDTTLIPNRLGLSQWMFAPEHPLTARVAVNRYWQLIMGRGIVATPGDFGSQGSLPTHPALLDWLALSFQESQWDLKALIKQIVMSATYRQSVTHRPIHTNLDPDNIYLSRGPHMRLPAEMVRDHALALSGLLGDRLGGPSVKPYQPSGLWLEIASGNQSLRKYIQDHDEDLYRRSLYSFWKRSLPPPAMTVFDAPMREQCRIERRSTHTPMQALVLLNDPQFVEASRLIATRMVLDGGNSPREKIEWAFRLATSRKPQSKELRILEKLFKKERLAFTNDEASAKQLLSIGEFPVNPQVDPIDLAAYTVVANAILNLTESIMKG